MSLTGIALILIAVSLFILVLTLLPAVVTIKRTAASVGALSDMIQKELKPTIQEFTSVLTELKTVGGGIAEHTEDVKQLMSALGETGTNIRSINRSVSVVTDVLSTASIWATGAKVAGKYMLEHYLKKRGGM
jgi:uncharacterized protein YoxC